MVKITLQKYGIWIVSYLVTLSYFYIFGAKILGSYFNYFMYFIAFILAAENYRKSNLNKDIVLIFKYFYFYISCILVFSLGVRVVDDPSLLLITYLYTDIGISSMVLLVSIYLFIVSLDIKGKSSYKLIAFSVAITLVITFINYYKFILIPESYQIESMRELYVIKKHLFNFISILLLLVFWIRYYNRVFILSEYLSIIVYLFMLSNILDAIYYIAAQHHFQFFKYSLYISLILNTLFIVFWYIRLEYLNSPLGKENEKYLANYQLLHEFVNKPKRSVLQKVFTTVSPNLMVLFLFLIVFGIILLYLAKFVNLYLMLNTIFIIVVTILAIFYSFSSIKRNWTNQIGFMLENKKEKV